VEKTVAGKTTTLQTVTKAQQVSTALQHIRLRVVGSTIQFRTWVDGQAEPATWAATLTDASITGAGQLFLSLNRGTKSVGTREVRLDNLTLTGA
jgi:hypothetical protein